MNFASAVWSSVCSCGCSTSPVRRFTSACSISASSRAFPDLSLMLKGHGEKSMYTGSPDARHLFSHSVSLSVSAAISLLVP